MNAVNFYVTACRMIMQLELEDSDDLKDFDKHLLYLRQSLTCCACTKILQVPYGPVDSACCHHVCQACLGRKMVLKPPCSWCKNYEAFVENTQYRIVLQCFKQMCVYLAGSPRISRASKREDNQLDSSNSLQSIIQDGCNIEDDYMHSIQGLALSSMFTQMAPADKFAPAESSYRGQTPRTSESSLPEQSNTRFITSPGRTRRSRNQTNVSSSHERSDTDAFSDSSPERFSPNHSPRRRRRKGQVRGRQNNKNDCGPQPGPSSDCNVVTLNHINKRRSSDSDSAPNDLKLNGVDTSPFNQEILSHTVAQEHDYIKDSSLLTSPLLKEDSIDVNLCNLGSDDIPTSPARRRSRTSASESDSHPEHIAPVTSCSDTVVTKKKRSKLSLNKNKSKIKIGCRCGMATPSPGKLTCCGQRCPCYSKFMGCLPQCRCRGCRNPRQVPLNIKVPESSDSQDSDVEVDV